MSLATCVRFALKSPHVAPTVRYCRENWNWFLRYVPICATPLIRVKPGPSVYSTSFE